MDSKCNLTYPKRIKEEDFLTGELHNLSGKLNEVNLLFY